MKATAIAREHGGFTGVTSAQQDWKEVSAEHTSLVYSGSSGSWRIAMRMQA